MDDRDGPGGNTPPPGRPVTMAEIARLAGVAESTVSRALTGSSRVSEDTKQRIRGIVEASGYKVNVRARALRTRETRTIEVVIPISDANRQHFSDPFFSQLIAAIGDALAEADYDLLLSRLPPWSDKPGADAVTAGRADGVIIIGQGDKPDLVNRHAERGYPMVVWGAQLPGAGYCSVGGDNRKGGELVGRHLRALGRTRVAFLGDVRHVEIGQRHQGCMEALAEGRPSSEPMLTLAMPFDAESAYAATKSLTGGGSWHDAIFAASDVIAIAAIQALQDAGLKVPEDVAVIGYDDIDIAGFLSPALTTVRQDTRAAGRLLVEKLLAAIEGEKPESVVLDTELIVRRSCGAKRS